MTGRCNPTLLLPCEQRNREVGDACQRGLEGYQQQLVGQRPASDLMSGKILPNSRTQLVRLSGGRTDWVLLNNVVRTGNSRLNSTSVCSSQMVNPTPCFIARRGWQNEHAAG
jgi:hypothetical protein